jgi:hypothetical protein
VAAADEIVSPELVLVSPPEIAAQARAALPNFEYEWQQLVARMRAEAAVAAEPEAAEPEAAEPEPPARLTLGAVAFTVAAAVTSVAPLVLLILLR